MNTNRKRSSAATSLVIVLLCMALCVAVPIGCTSRGGLRSMSAVSQYFDKDVNTVWDAALQVIEGIRVNTVDKEKGTIRTQWVKRWSRRKTTGVLLEGQWQERYRLIIKVSGEQNKTYVSVNTQIEEKPPGGSGAYRWSRVPSDGTIEQEFLKKLENILANQ